MDSSKSLGYHLQIAGLRRRSSRHSICLYPGKKCFPNCWKFPKIGMSRHLDSSTTTQMVEIISVSKTQLFFLNGIYTVIRLQDFLWEWQFEKIFLQLSWEKVSVNLDVLTMVSSTLYKHVDDGATRCCS